MAGVLERDRPADRTLLDLAAHQRRFASELGAAMAAMQARPDAAGTEPCVEILRRCQSLQDDVGTIVRLLLLSQSTAGRG